MHTSPAGRRILARLTEVCDRWVYSTCLCFALDRQEQQRSGFRYQYSCFQVEYSRNLLFARGTALEEVYQGFIDRTRRVLDVPTLKTIFGRKHRPHQLRQPGATIPRIERVLDGSVYDLTVFKVHFGRLTLKVLTKGRGCCGSKSSSTASRSSGAGRALRNSRSCWPDSSAW